MHQKEALDILKTGRNVYLTGVAGSGKTHVLNEYIRYLKAHGINVGVTASTGIAATHLGGMTIHSWSGIGIKDYLTEADVEELEQKEYLWKRFEKTNILIIDEISMLTPWFFESIDKIARAMKRTQKPFGGMQIVLSGDFFQLPPVVRGSEEINFVNESNVWRDMDVRVCYLGGQYRHKGDTLESILNEMRTGRVSKESKDEIKKQTNKDKNKLDFEPTRLFTHNKDVDKLNDEELSKIKEKEYKYKMQTRGRKNLVESLKKGVLAPEVLKLKKGAVVMFIKNNFEAGYVNGTLGTVEGFENGYPIIKTLGDEKIVAEETSWIVEEDGKEIARVEQIPLRLAWAITVHKSQGMSMDAAEMDLSKSFVAGQGYVALSRLRSMDGLFLLGINETVFYVNEKIVEFDKILQKESNKWSVIIENFSRKKIDEMQNEFILKCGGSIEEIKEEKKKGKFEKGVSTYEKTRELLGQKKTLKEISKERGLKEETIISHLEKLKKEEKIEEKDIKKFKPKKKDFEKIKEAFEKEKDKFLKPIYKKLKGKYSFKDIRLVRLFLD